MNSLQRKRLSMVLRRMNFLENRFRNETAKDLTFDRGEWLALKFAVECIKLADSNNLITKDVGKNSFVEIA